MYCLLGKFPVLKEAVKATIMPKIIYPDCSLQSVKYTIDRRKYREKMRKVEIDKERGSLCASV